jgi:hypothetical protein
MELDVQHLDCENVRRLTDPVCTVQYGVISKLSLVVAAAICAIYLFRIQTPEQEKAGLTRYDVVPSK